MILSFLVVIIAMVIALLFITMGLRMIRVALHERVIIYLPIGAIIIVLTIVIMLKYFRL